MPVTQQTFGQAAPDRLRWQSLKRGFAMRCPNCGEGRIYGRFLKVNERCSKCGEEFHHHRADDAPAYFTILIVGHIVVPGLLFSEQMFFPPVWVHAAIWLPTLLLLTLALLPRIKGALIAYQWAQRMHGFGGHEEKQW
jgi:uncharacterized protein (DUF983 family)